ncbi:hypothetical protein FISHEDRAFT_33231 [Fistulina hepatica ATCC 64428]|uniref:CxC2-like cysteine cluster KDZ transposase-associated domain-containing protein n=1 Tax=Fistulina hepatica ATCC 64428 TaxID=1128425 RepID=A0A0D7ANY6_9AGAR|nr:hypothetical protein FISHEDRAFT_33231 [Fistulina hepatica ATCC 64428]
MCWISAHVHNPWHWALMWQPDQGFFHRMDISRVVPGHAHCLGHRGEHCPHLSRLVQMIIVHTNGIHRTCLSYCECNTMECCHQLLRSRLFPATPDDPKTVFTFNVLDEFSVHELQSRASAYSYIEGLRDLTDSSFPGDVHHPYNQFLCVTQVWNHVNVLKESGQYQGMDAHSRLTIPGDIRVHCTACPEHGLNTTINDIGVPPEGR